ncbi:glycosyltransferase family 4 protein [Ekhidna sp.]
MRIAFVANTCWNIYNFRKGLVQKFLSDGHEIIALAPEDEYTKNIEDWGVKWIETPLDGTGTNPFKDFSYFYGILKAFKTERPQIALGFTIKSNIYASIASIFCSTSVICNVSGLGTTFLVKGLAGKLAIQLYKIAFRYSSYIFFQNVDDKNLFSSIIKINTDKVGVLPGSGIDLKSYQVEPLNNNQPIKFLMISRLIIEKGVYEYAEAASYFLDDDRVKFTLIGKLDELHSRTIQKTELEEWVNNEWIDYMTHSNDIAQIIKEHDVVVLPSYREGTPRTLLEGAALGRPLLASNVPGCKEVIKDGYNGFLFGVRDVKSLVDKIRLYLSLSKDEKNVLSTNSRKLVEDKYDENIVIDMYSDVIRRITREGSNI